MPQLLTDTEPQQYRKPRANIYTVLLTVALLATIAGILALYGFLASYKFESRPPSASLANPPATAALVAWNSTPGESVLG